ENQKGANEKRTKFHRSSSSLYEGVESPAKVNGARLSARLGSLTGSSVAKAIQHTRKKTRRGAICAQRSTASNPRLIHNLELDVADTSPRWLDAPEGHQQRFIR